MLQERGRQAERLERRYTTIANARLAAFFLGIAVALAAFGLGWLSAWWLLLPLAGFLALISVHDRVKQAWQRSTRAVAFYQRGIARLEDRWQGSGEGGDRLLDREPADEKAPQHPYAADLDLFGAGSLFQLLCTARTRAGEETLAAWLKAPAAIEDIRSRQAAVAELRPRLDLREDLAVIGSDVRAGIDPDAIVRWGSEPPLLTSVPQRIGVEVLSLLAVATLVGWLGFDLGPLPFLAVVAAEGAYGLWFWKRVRRVTATIDKTGHDLVLLGEVLARIERESFTTPRLVELRERLVVGRQPPSQRIAHLVRLIEWLNARQNQLFLPVALLLMWTTRLAFAIDAWRVVSGPAIARWLAIVGEFEALGSLAGYSYENPADPFPEIVAGGPMYCGKRLGHPLLPRERCVRNDVQLGGERRVLIVSGSNMSGKSTLLRTVGINAVLGLMGAPVRAEALTLSPLAIGATLRIQDSLQAGRSRFYAELVRVRQLVDMTSGSLPLLFLLDEIFHGTNSHDRRQGAEAILNGLVNRGAIGLVTTHDLALADIAARLAPRAENVHFADHLENGVMVFDYTMRPGVVQHSNALALMRAVGLEV